MNGNCFDIGRIQAFLDGELSHEESAAVSSHAALCPSCARELAAAEDESTAVFAALERELDSLVPTHRLWNKINDAIVDEKKNAPIRTKVWAGLRAAFLSPTVAIAASLLIVLGISAALYLRRPAPVPFESPVARRVVPTDQPAQQAANDPEPTVSTSTRPTIERAAYRPDNETLYRRAMYYPPPTSALGENYLPGEESYVKTIASLSKTVNEQKASGAIRPSERVSYERDMAVVNDAIKKLRKAVKRDPKNESAKQILYASYQNKIDLLNSVAQREELVASLR
ncbi:MAG: zf-HC2 domain-containing protein [Acidobacteria bacterium]|nr:zf-HC2 domain-containing protein [Acidobacteriota bacterium]